MSEFQPHSHFRKVEAGSRFYSEKVTGAHDVTKAATPLILLATDRIPHKRDSKKEPIVICDYGAADGGVSMDLMWNIIESVKKNYGNDQVIQIIYEDQATNDFNALFARIYGSSSYLKEYNNVFVTACGTSFYEQCFPNETVDMALSSLSMHWLSRRPCFMSDDMWYKLSKNPEHRKCFEEQAAKDWERILLKRATELKKGGQMVIICSCTDAQGNCGGSTREPQNSVPQHMTNIWKQMREEKKILQEEFEKPVFTYSERTEIELTKPLTDKDSPVYQAGLRLISIVVKIARCPCNTLWIESGHSKDDKDAALSYAKRFVSAIQAWSNSTLRSALSDDRTQEEKSDLVDEFFRKYEEHVAEDPEKHACDIVTANMHIEKM